MPTALAQQQKDMLIELLTKMDHITQAASIPFSDYLKGWLEDSKINLRENTYNSYHLILWAHLLPYGAQSC